jgi:hypothetical protein
MHRQPGFVGMADTRTQTIYSLIEWFVSYTTVRSGRVRIRRASAGGLAILILAAGGFLTGAWAGTSSGYSTWVTFSSSGTTLCGQDRASVDEDSNGPIGWGTERALDSGCSSGHSRPAGYYGVFATLLRDSGTVCNTSGWQYNPEVGNYMRIGTQSGTCSNADNYRDRTKGREYDGDSTTYHEDSSYVYSPYWAYYP